MKIYQPSGRAREYSPLALNYFKGCTHNCAYCYVSKLNARFGNGVTQAVCNPPTEAGFKELERSAKQFEGCNKQILLSFTGDPYCDMDPVTTRRVLEILNRHNHKVAILTKGGNRMLNDIDLFKQFGDRIKVGATLTFSDEYFSSKWEPGATLPHERVNSLKKVAEHGIKTWASFEPVVIPAQSLQLMEYVAPFIDHIRIGKLNNFKGYDKKIDWTKFLQNAVRLCRKLEIPFYIKNDLADFNINTFLEPHERNADYLNL